MRKIIFILLLASVSSSYGSAQLEIHKFRFNRHAGQGFERLVIEFGAVGDTSNVSVRQNPSGAQEVSINIDKAALTGAIPESAINDNFTPKSHMLGPISIGTDNPQGGFSVRAFLKDTHAKVDAFWLSKPARLIIDAYQPDSVRASSRDVLGSSGRYPASKTHQPKNRNVASGTPSDIYCFPVSAQVKAKIGFELYEGYSRVAVAMKDPAKTPQNLNESIVCFPTVARVNPTLTFYSSDVPLATPVNSPAQEKPITLAPQEWMPATSTPAPNPITAMPSTPTIQSPKEKAEAQLNAEADAALSIPSTPGAEPAPVDEKRKVAAEPMLVPFGQDFNKNNPPPTLGKPLLPPTQNSGGKTPVMANPGSLLPPM